MNNQVPKYVTQARASFLLGMPEGELSRISKESGLGHIERAGKEKETYFTYEELQRICLLAVGSDGGSPLNRYPGHFGMQGRENE